MNESILQYIFFSWLWINNNDPINFPSESFQRDSTSVSCDQEMTMFLAKLVIKLFKKWENSNKKILLLLLFFLWEKTFKFLNINKKNIDNLFCPLSEKCRLHILELRSLYLECKVMMEILYNPKKWRKR